MKIFILSTFSIFLTLSIFGQNNLAILINRIKSIDKTWKVEIDKSKKGKPHILNGGNNIGFLILKKEKEEIRFYIYKSTNMSIDSSIKQIQKIASCNNVDLLEKNQIAKQKDLVIFLSIYPCWTTYAENSKILIKKIFKKLKVN